MRFSRTKQASEVIARTFKATQRLSLFAMVLLQTGIAMAQPTRNKEKGYDATYWEIRKAKYQWGDRQKNSEKSFGQSDKNQWYYREIAPMPGFVDLMDGTRIEGSLTVRYNFNESSTYKITVDGQKKKNPDGRTYYEVFIQNEEQEALNYQMKEVQKYGIDYRINDFEKNEFKDGEIVLKNGEALTGKVFLGSWKSRYEGMKYHGQLMFASAEDATIELYQSDKIETAKVGKEQLLEFDGWQISIQDFKESFTNRASENKFTILAPGKVTLQDGSIYLGMITVQDKKKITKGYLITDEESTIISLTPENTGVIRINDGTEYAKFQNYIQPLPSLMKKWKKRGDLQPGKIVFANGNEVLGDIGFERTQNAVASYRKISGVYYFPEGEMSYLFDVESDIDHVIFNNVKYVPLNKYFIDYTNFVEALSEHTHPGYLMMKDGAKKEGQVFVNRSTISFIGTGNDLARFSATDNDIQYCILKKEGGAKKFVPMRSRSSIRTVDYRFVEIKEHDKRFSYYENPYPDNVRKGLTKLAGNTVNSGIQRAADELNKEAAKQAAKRELEESGNVLSAAEAASENYNPNGTDIGVETGGDEGIFFKEYVLLDHSNGKKYVIFKRNDQELLTALLSGCSAYNMLKDRDKKRVTRMESLAEAVSILNKCN